MGTGENRSTEDDRLREDAARTANWKRWGPYLSARQWGTVREDYSASGDCWSYFPHEHARSRAYRWGEDGLLGITDRECRLCFALALWNGKDPFLKERLFGLTGHEGNHGEDVKEEYFYLSSSPTHSYMKALYKYPQTEFPYARLLAENARRSRQEPEFELKDTGIFDDNRYFDVFAEYAKASPDDILIRITIHNRGAEAAGLHLLPTLWFRNTWSWNEMKETAGKPSLIKAGDFAIEAQPATLGKFFLSAEPGPGGINPELLFTENETNMNRLFGVDNASPHVKDAFHEYLVRNESNAVNHENKGTKAAFCFHMTIPAGEAVTVRLRLAPGQSVPAGVGADFDGVFKSRIDETEAFYGSRLSASLSEDARRIILQAYGGLLWNKQFYHYIVREWLSGDPGQPPPPSTRRNGRNSDWLHVYSRDVFSMPDNWEYPWFAAWDLAFHMIPLARLDPQYAKEQLVLLLREWYMHPNGELPAYEFDFGDVNPPVHAWACWRLYKVSAERGSRDRMFLSRCFQKLIIYFTWWVNRKDLEGKNLFAGGFLGLDNIGLFDRSKPLPDGGMLEQADGTAWMAFFCATMLSIALELSRDNPATEDMASKFFEHFVAISDAINFLGGNGLWDETDGFYYDQFKTRGTSIPVKVRSLVGLIPLLAVELLDDDLIQQLPGFKKRLDWFLENRSDLNRQITYCCRLQDGKGHCFRLLAIPSQERLVRMLGYMLDENEFLSPFGIRSLSRIHMKNPCRFVLDGIEHQVDYEPGESATGLFGGNSNWRGPVWFPLNYLIIEALERYHRFYGEDLKVECPTGSGKKMNLKEVAEEISHRLVRIFLPDDKGERPWAGSDQRFSKDPFWRDLTLFHEYFHGETGLGLGASHQTGWTSLLVRLIEDQAQE